jgi:uncharacterized membrane protein
MRIIEKVQSGKVSGNGASSRSKMPQAIDPGARPSPEAEAERLRMERYGRFWERAVVASLTLMLCGAYVAFRYYEGNGGRADLWTWLCLLFVTGMLALFFTAFVLAVKFNARAFRAKQQVDEGAAQTTAYEITDQRLATLQAKGLPWDVQRCLREMMASTAPEPVQFKGGEKLVAELEQRLGPERTSEFSDLILKYTRARGAACG